MASNICRNCGNPEVITDPDNGFRVCESCGFVNDSDVFQHQSFASDGTPLGSIIHSAGDFGYREQKLYRARSVIHDLTSRLSLSHAHAARVSHLASDATDGELGSGRWFAALVAACAVIVMRQDHSPLSISEAAAVIGRHPHDLGRMISRVARHLDLDPLPDFDPVLLLERLVSNFKPFSDLDKMKKEEILGQGRFILHCATRWFLTTGRHPLPIVAAVLAFVADVNGVVVSVEKIAREIHAGISTSRLRLKELMELLVKASKVLLPWGNDVTVKNIVQHAPILIRLMELKSKTKSNLVGDGNACLSNSVINLDDILNACSNYIDVAEEESKYFRLGKRDGGDQRLGGDEIQRLKLSGEQISVSHAYDRILEMRPGFCDEGDSENVYGSKPRRAGLEIQDWIESWKGRWESDKGLKHEQVLQRSEGYDTLPPSFINGIDLRRKRRMKMESAKHRIHKIQKRTPDVVEVEPSRGEDVSPIELPPSRKRRKKDGATDELDWEDSIIELLLLRQVEEEEILQGHYSRLMDVTSAKKSTFPKRTETKGASHLLWLDHFRFCHHSKTTDYSTTASHPASPVAAAAPNRAQEWCGESSADGATVRAGEI